MGQPSLSAGTRLTTRGRQDMSCCVRDAALSLALCCNVSYLPDWGFIYSCQFSKVTPVINDGSTITYQASSPDEAAIVTRTQPIGLTLAFRDRTRIELQTSTGPRTSLKVLDIFPFTSEFKRMGIVVKDVRTGEITFLQKEADVVKAKIVQRNDWLEEETSNMAREGLRTLLMARKRLSRQLYNAFKTSYHDASVKL